MKKILKYAMLFASVIALGTSFSACSDDDDKNEGKLSEKQTAMKELTEQYVNNVIYPIYSSLANQTSVLFEQLVDAKKKYRAGSLNQSDIDKICATFINARSAWEQSESFLYGAATDWGIDPHIDTWPLDRVALAKQLSSSEIVEELDDLDEGGIDNARALVGEQQLGFHGIEFIIFRDGKNRSVAALQAKESDEAFAKYNVTGEQELEYAALGPDLCGINNRNLGSFHTDVENSFRLAELLPKDAVTVSESGISDPATVRSLRAAGFCGFLIGENFMKTAAPGLALHDFITQLTH